MSNESQVLEILKTRGLSDEAIAGIMANIDVETGGSFDYQQRQYGGGPGYGLFQLDSTGPLPKAYNKWLGETERTDSAESQIDFMLETIYGDYKNIIGAGHAAKLRSAFEEGDSEKVAKEFMERWERPGVPHLDRRLKSARRYGKIVAAPQKTEPKDKDPIEQAGVRTVQPEQKEDPIETALSTSKNKNSRVMDKLLKYFYGRE